MMQSMAQTAGRAIPSSTASLLISSISAVLSAEVLTDLISRESLLGPMSCGQCLQAPVFYKLQMKLPEFVLLYERGAGVEYVLPKSANVVKRVLYLVPLLSLQF